MQNLSPGMTVQGRAWNVTLKLRICNFEDTNLICDFQDSQLWCVAQNCACMYTCARAYVHTCVVQCFVIVQVLQMCSVLQCLVACVWSPIVFICVLLLFCLFCKCALRCLAGGWQQATQWPARKKIATLPMQECFYFQSFSGFLLFSQFLFKGRVHKKCGHLHPTEVLLIELILQVGITLRCLESPWGVFGLKWWTLQFLTPNSYTPFTKQ